MATIHGIELRNLAIIPAKSRYSHPKETGTVYLNGKSLGRWIADAYEDGDRFDFGTSKLEAAISAQCPEFTSSKPAHTAPALSKLIRKVIAYNEAEANWNEANANGCALLSMTAEDGKRTSYRIRKRDDLAATKLAAKHMAEMVADEGNLGNYTDELFWDEKCFVVGEPLVIA